MRAFTFEHRQGGLVWLPEIRQQKRWVDLTFVETSVLAVGRSPPDDFGYELALTCDNAGNIDGTLAHAARSMFRTFDLTCDNAGNIGLTWTNPLALSHSRRPYLCPP